MDYSQQEGENMRTNILKILLLAAGLALPLAAGAQMYRCVS
jgi:hypothetical protein